jgi:hypothetical protein
MKIGCFVEKYNFHTKEEAGAVEAFKRTAEAKGHLFDYLFKPDLNRIGEYDAIFIRATTDPMNTAYVVSRTAEALGKVVIDDPHSIRVCSSKVVLDDLFKQNSIPSPRSLLFDGDYGPENLRHIFENLGFPVVLKAPYTKFSSHVEKASNEAEFRDISARYLRNAIPIVLQEFMPSGFDWRVGVLELARERPDLHIVAEDLDIDARLPGRILASTRKCIDVAVFTALKEIAEGRFQPGHRVLGMKEGGIGLSEMKFTRQLFTEEQLSFLERAKQALRDGRLSVPASDEELQAFRAPVLR